MKKILLAVFMLSAVACTKNKTDVDKTTDPTEGQMRCGTILETPTLDSFVSPTFYISVSVRFKEGDERIHFHADVTEGFRRT